MLLSLERIDVRVPDARSSDAAYLETLLHETVKAAVERRSAYGTERGTPGDLRVPLQRRGREAGATSTGRLGVPGLGFKRGLADDLVIAPYAHVPGASGARRAAACRNLGSALRRAGSSRRYGFYEAIDYTPSRMTARRTSRRSCAPSWPTTTA
mgnify:CR=1 FL=1